MTSPTQVRADRSELGMVTLLGAVGVAITVDALRLDAPYAQSDVLGPKVVPFIVAGILFACAGALAVEVLRGHGAVPEAGEDVDPTTPIEWRTVITLVAVLVATMFLIDRLGWVITGAFLFWGTVWALGSRHYVRDPLISVGLSLATFYGFYSGLGILLPAGPLDGLL